MDNVNFASTNSTFNNPADLYVLPSTKKEMDARKDLDVYQRNGTEEQNRKKSLQEISSATQKKQSSFQQSQSSTTNGCKSEWNHNHHNYPMGCPLLPLHDQLSSLKKSFKEKNNEIHISEQIPFSPSRPNSSMDNYNRQSQKSSNNDQCLLEVESEKDYKRCIWCINFSPNRKKKVPTCCNQKKERSIPSSSGPEWRCDLISINMDVRELRGDECLDYFMSVQTRSSNQISNSISSDKRSVATMRKLPSLSELVEAVKNDHKYREFHEHKDKWLIDQEYFSDIYGITNVHPLLVDSYGANLMFLDDCGILFAWCAITESMFIFGINIMEGLANFLYHSEKKFIIETNGELILHVELERQ